MKIGCCSNMLVKSSAPVGEEQEHKLKRTGFDFLEKIAKVGFDYVELPLAQVMALDEEHFERLLDKITELGLPCEACNNFFPVTMRLTGPSVDQEAVDAYVAAALQRARRMGARSVIFGSGPAKNVPDGFKLEDGYRQLVDMLKRVDDFAGRENVTIAIEPLRKQECNLINTYEAGYRMAQEVAGKNIRVLVDYYHLGTEREPVEHILAGKEWLQHTHTASLDRRSFPVKLDDQLNEDFYRALKTAGYDDCISLEAYTDDFDHDAPLSLAFLRHQIENAKPFAQ